MTQPRAVPTLDQGPGVEAASSATEPGATPTVQVTRHGGETVITVRGALDSVVARAVNDAVSAALHAEGTGSIEIDLREMDDWTSGGLRDLAACTGLGVRVRMGPHVVRTP